MKKECGQCPFKKDSLPGYLGEASHNPMVFLASMEYKPLPCHLTVDWEDEDFDMDAADNCIGALKYLRNTCKRPIDDSYEKLRQSVERDPNIFETRSQFINHHS